MGPAPETLPFTVAAAAPASRNNRTGLQKADEQLISLMMNENGGRSSYVVVVTKCDKVSDKQVRERKDRNNTRKECRFFLRNGQGESACWCRRRRRCCCCCFLHPSRLVGAARCGSWFILRGSFRRNAPWFFSAGVWRYSYCSDDGE